MILSMTFEVDVSDDANTTVLPTDGSCSHLGDRCQSEEASEDWRKHLIWGTFAQNHSQLLNYINRLSIYVYISIYILPRVLKPHRQCTSV